MGGRDALGVVSAIEVPYDDSSARDRPLEESLRVHGKFAAQTESAGQSAGHATGRQTSFQRARNKRPLCERARCFCGANVDWRDRANNDMN